MVGPELALALTNLGVILGDLGEREGAVDVLREAVRLDRCLQEARPEAFEPQLATSLSNFGRH